MKDPKSAFPIFDSIKEGSDYECLDGGMTLRDYFAGQILQAMIACGKYECGKEINADNFMLAIAQTAYQIADTML